MNRYAVSFTKPETPKFTIGTLSITPGIHALLTHDEILAALKRHMLGDWGDGLDLQDQAANEAALKGGGRLVSRYLSVSQQPFYVITEADREFTTLLLPEEY